MNYTQLATKEETKKTIDALTKNNIDAVVVDTAKDAMDKIKNLIPEGATVMNGSSKTLEEIGFIDYLKEGSHPWKNLHAKILSQKDPKNQALFRMQATLSDYYLGSVHAVSQTGELIIGSNTGSQLAHIVYSSPNLIFIVGSQKIVPTVQEGMKRLEEYVVPLEDKNMLKKFGAHTALSKVVIFKKENPMMGRKVKVIFVNQVFGF